MNQLGFNGNYLLFSYCWCWFDVIFYDFMKNELNSRKMSKGKEILMIILENLQKQTKSDKYSRCSKCCKIVNKIICGKSNAFLIRFLSGIYCFNPYIPWRDINSFGVFFVVSTKKSYHTFWRKKTEHNQKSILQSGFSLNTTAFLATLIGI